MQADDTSSPKQYRMLGGKTVLQRTIECFSAYPQIDQIQVVIHRDDEALYEQSIQPLKVLAPPVFGGATRQESCHAGVRAAQQLGADTVLIHDAARPFLDEATIDNVLKAVAPGIGVVPAAKLADTVKTIDEDGMVAETLNRDTLRACQTPQGFVASEILAAHQRAESAGINTFTDDAAVAEWAGMAVKVVDGSSQNTKITTPDDLIRAEQSLAMNPAIPDIRTGHGYDTHVLVPGNAIILCGVEIAHEFKLSGHSDADVGLHALTDALLATIAAGDIGSHFPPSDPKWKGAGSSQFLEHAVSLVAEKAGQINHVDVTLICEAPKIAPHRDAMRTCIAEGCRIDPERVSVKATTNEKIGFIGRNEGIAAFATATVAFAS